MEGHDGRQAPDSSLRACGVSRSFAGVLALNGVSLELRLGEVVGLIGPNGAGKTTLINVLTGFDQPTAGTVTLNGRDVTAWSPARRAHAGLVRTFQHGHLFRGLTVRENVELAALAVGASREEAQRRAEQLLETLGLADRAEQPAASLPHGDERKVGVARALASRPRYVLMDEPAAGLPEAEIAPLVQAIRSARDGFAVGILVVDHNMALVMEVSDRIQVLDQGSTLAHGTPEQIRANLDVAAAYLGSPGTESPSGARGPSGAGGSFGAGGPSGAGGSARTENSPGAGGFSDADGGGWSSG